MKQADNFIYRENCEICASTNPEVLISRVFTDPSIWSFLTFYYNNLIEEQDIGAGIYEIRKCKNCGFIWQSYILNDKYMDKLYSSWISPAQSLAKKESADLDHYIKYANELTGILMLLQKKPSEINILDFSMGWGHWCIMAKAFGYHVTGFEIARDKIEYAKKRGIDVISNFSDLNKYQFDFINSEQTLEHVPKPLQYLNSLALSLTKGGVVRISVPDGKNIETELKRSNWTASKNAIQPLEHINCFNHKTLIESGKKVGLKQIIEPPSFGLERNLGSLIKNLVKKKYRKYFSTSLYFKKY